MTKCVAAIDQGTTSTRCMLFNHAGEPIGSHQLEHEQIYPKPGWVEHDPEEIWARTQDVVKGAMQELQRPGVELLEVTRPGACAAGKGYRSTHLDLLLRRRYSAPDNVIGLPQVPGARGNPSLPQQEFLYLVGRCVGQ